MAWHYKKDCFCQSCRDYRRANDYRSTCDCVDCTMVRANVCGNSGRVGASCSACGDGCACSRCSASSGATGCLVVFLSLGGILLSAALALAACL